MKRSPLGNLLGAGAVTFGVVAVAAPSALHRAYGMTDTPTSRNLMRMWGTRTAALGGLALRARDDDLDEWMLVLAGMNGLDALLDLAAIRDGVSSRPAVAAAATSALFSALMLVARSLD